MPQDILFGRLDRFSADLTALRDDFERHVRPCQPTQYFHNNSSYEGWAITSRDGSISDGVKRVPQADRVLNGIRIEQATTPTRAATATFRQVLDDLSRLGMRCFRSRVMRLSNEGFEMTMHRDATRESWRLHIPLITTPESIFEWDVPGLGLIQTHLPADGSAWLVRVDIPHRAVNRNPGQCERIHFLTSVERGISRNSIQMPFVIRTP